MSIENHFSSLRLLVLLLLVSILSCNDDKEAALPDTTVKVSVPKKVFGGGSSTTGGREGAVMFVTSLEDDVTKSGTLRWVLNQPGAKIVLFRIAGIIELKSELRLRKGSVTIAGESAPGDGICIKNYPFIIDADNVIVRFLRFRMGNQGASEGDAITCIGHTNIVVDHCSMSWSTDETATFYENTNFTLQYCIISESLRNSNHSKGAHGYGGIWGGNNATFHHNLLAHHDSRNPRFDHDGVSALRGPIDYVNNVVYNWGGNSSYGGENRSINIVNNYYKAGPATSKKNRIFNPAPSTGLSPFCGDEVNSDGRYFITGNYVYNYPDVTADNWLSGVQGVTDLDKDYFKVLTPFLTTAINYQSAEEAFQQVLDLAGASLLRDTIDKRIVNEVYNGTYTYVGGVDGKLGIIDSQEDVGAWPTYSFSSLKLDTDRDGISDEWEEQHGLNKLSSSDGMKKTVDIVGVYTNLEVYLNSLVSHLYP